MNDSRDLLLSRWHEVKDEIRQRWNRVTEPELAGLSGRTEELAVVLQEHYGYSKPQAVMEIFKWLQVRQQASTAHDLDYTAGA